MLCLEYFDFIKLFIFVYNTYNLFFSENIDEDFSLGIRLKYPYHL